MRRAVLLFVFGIGLIAFGAPSAFSDDDTPSVVVGPDRQKEAGFRGIYMMNRDGSHVQLVTGGPGVISSSAPAMSPDGKMIAYDAVTTPDDVNQSKVMVYALEGPFKGLTRELGFGNTPAWSPDGKQIAFMLNAGNPAKLEGGVWVMDSDGSNRRRLSEGFYPRWSPDGKSICCHAWSPDGSPSLFVVDVAFRDAHPLLNENWKLSLYGGTWSSDGKSVVFIGTFEGKEHVATVSANGAPDSVHILYTRTAEDQTLLGPPAWSPDGKQIVFAIQDEANVKGPRRWWKSYLYSMAAEVPSAPVLLERTKVGNINRGMAWSPDSKKILFSSER